jgi:hypothetical protein
MHTPENSISLTASTPSPLPPAPHSKVGIALSTLNQLPINGMRIQPGEGVNGWFFWCGNTCSDAPDFFASLHVEHLPSYLPEVIGHLDLPPGSRIQLDRSGYEDVWFEQGLAEQRFPR